MKKLVLSNDVYEMNWVEGRKEWGTVACHLPLEVEKKSEREGDVVRESYCFVNRTDREIFTSLTDLGIYTTFHDDYEDAESCLTNRCHAHIWCGGAVSYVMALRMGGEAPHLGLIVTRGSIEGYSVERDLERGSNDRGDFILHPTPFVLAPNESYCLEWTLFPFENRQDFYEKAAQYNKKFIRVEAEKYVLFSGENIGITLTPAFAFEKGEVLVTEQGRAVELCFEENQIVIREKAKEVREYCYDIWVGGVHTRCRLFVQAALEELAEARCHFVADKQQYYRKDSHLDGAYLIYDNEEQHIRYDRKNDHNAGRERVGMGLLMAKYLQRNKDKVLEASFERYLSFVRRELVDETTGEVFNDYLRDDSYTRMYNIPWYAQLFTEVYEIDCKREYLELAYRILLYFYKEGGSAFYAIGLPMVAAVNALRKEGMLPELEVLLGFCRKHGDYLLQTGTSYPKLEVNYEQSIVAPAADILFQAYEVTGEEKYLEGGQKQLAVLELFQGEQPDYHLNEVAIRHWDGYWFGKRQLYGDTFPHYWSSLTGIVYARYAKACKKLGETEQERIYTERADKALRGVLSLIRANGTASCAYIFPVSVNQVKADFADPYANDQDWGVYHALKYLSI
ncbi:MAG: six-hairpin glycosidase [bacterium]|nr:six-hairpin glycosidase [bacterium]